jgi:hypothetical protein
MTRYLSLALGASEPTFGHSIRELERAGGQPNVDIRLSSELSSQLRGKLLQLGLDPADTTGEELYRALHERMRLDESHVRNALHVSDSATANEIIGTVQKFLAKKSVAGTCFALKAAVAKRLLKKKAPKATMKVLGYRSLDSMIKHENVSHIYAAAALVESTSWHHAFRDQYAKLTPSDFEQRPMTISFPKTKRWVALAEQHLPQAKQSIMCFKELGAVTLLPMPRMLEGMAITTLLLALHNMNDVRTYGSYIKLQQVKPDFGKIVQQTSYGEPMTAAELAGQPVPWRVIQRYYGRLKHGEHPEVFEPHVQPEDLAWKEAEEVLARLVPDIAFWQDTQYICALHDDQPVSMNALDVALSYCNRLAFTDRIVHFMRSSLWQELMARYLHQENLEAAVHQQLSMALLPAQAAVAFDDV